MFHFKFIGLPGYDIDQPKTGWLAWVVYYAMYFFMPE